MNEPNPKPFEEFNLGDALGQDDQLQSSIPSLNDRLNADAPRTGRRSTKELLELVSDGLGVAWSKLSAPVQWVWERFADYEIRQATAERIRAEASAIESKSKIDKQQATATVEKAKTEVMRTRNEAQLQLAEKLTALGIDWEAKVDSNGRLTIVVTKKRDP